jgi:hypothetical protein
MDETKKQTTLRPAVCFPWEEKLRELSEIKGDKKLAKKVWEDIDTFGYIYIWQCLLSF